MDRICILQNSMTYGGTDTFVINLCRGLVQDGFDVTVILSMDEDVNAPRKAELLSTGARIIWTCSLQRGFRAKIRHLGLLYRELKKGKYDVFQTNIDLFNGPQLLVAWLAGVPVRECHSHNSRQGRELSEGFTLPVRLYQGIMRHLCWKYSNRRGGCSELAMDFLFKEKWKKDSHSVVVHNGIDLSAYNEQFDIVEKRRILGLSKKYNICTAGRISSQKNPLFIVDVMNELFKIRDDCDFVWAGTGDMENEVRDRINQYGIADRMHMLGQRSDIAEIFRSCDIFFLPSNFEGLAIVLIEAQASGLPCVASTTVPPESDCGGVMYISPDRPAAYWAEQLSCILDGKTVLKPEKDKLDKFSIDHMVKEMEELFEA